MLLRPLNTHAMDIGTLVSSFPLSATDRRRFLRTGGSFAALGLIAGLGGCATDGFGGFSFVEAIRRLLRISSERAFAQLLAPNGFLDDQLTRITLPPQLGGAEGAGVLAAIMGTRIVRAELEKQAAQAARYAADRAAPVVADAIMNMTIADAVSVVRGGSQAATVLLRNAIGESLLRSMIPWAGEGLREADFALVSQAVRAASGIDLQGFRDDLASKATASIFKAIGREEAAIRANPASTNDPLLIGVFALAAPAR